MKALPVEYSNSLGSTKEKTLEVTLEAQFTAYHLVIKCQKEEYCGLHRNKGCKRKLCFIFTICSVRFDLSGDVQWAKTLMKI